MKRLLLISLLLCTMMLIMSDALAEEVSPYSDSVFVSWAAVLHENKKAEFSASTYAYYKEIKISKCILEEKINGRWINRGHLTKPDPMYDTIFYAGVCDYSSVIFSGRTYRMEVTFWADGHEMTRYSNERTY